jgi:tetratricopeptide (TPR) repeat protein
MGIKEKLPLINSASKKTRIIGYVAYVLIGWIVLVVMVPDLDNNLQNTALKYDNHTTDEWVALGNSFDYGSSSQLSAYENAVKVDPKNADAWYLIGEIHNENEKSEEAIQAFSKSHEIDPCNVTYMLAVGSTLDIMERYDEAVQSYDEILKMYPNYYPALDEKAYALYEAKKYDEALAASDKAIAINPDDLNAWIYRPMILDEMGRIAEADSADAEYKRIYDRVDYTSPLSEYDISRIKEWYKMGILTNQIAHDIDHHDIDVMTEVSRMIDRGELTKRN